MRAGNLRRCRRGIRSGAGGESAASRAGNTGAEDEKIHCDARGEYAAVRTGNPQRGARGICSGAGGKCAARRAGNLLWRGREISFGQKIKSDTERAGNAAAVGEKIHCDARGKYRSGGAFNIEETCTFCTDEKCSTARMKNSAQVTRKSRRSSAETCAHARAKISPGLSQSARPPPRENCDSAQPKCAAIFALFFVEKSFNRTGITQ